MASRHGIEPPETATGAWVVGVGAVLEGEGPLLVGGGEVIWVFGAAVWPVDGALRLVAVPVERPGSSWATTKVNAPAETTVTTMILRDVLLTPNERLIASRKSPRIVHWEFSISRERDATMNSDWEFSYKELSRCGESSRNAAFSCGLRHNVEEYQRSRSTRGRGDFAHRRDLSEYKLLGNPITLAHEHGPKSRSSSSR